MVDITKLIQRRAGWDAVSMRDEATPENPLATYWLREEIAICFDQNHYSPSVIIMTSSFYYRLIVENRLLTDEMQQTEEYPDGKFQGLRIFVSDSFPQNGAFLLL